MDHFINLTDVTDINLLVQEGLAQKKSPFKDELLGKRKTIGLIFFNSSLRTRLSTQKAAQNLGMSVIVMNVGSDSWQIEFEDGVYMDQGKAEHIREAAAVMGSYCDILAVRSFAGLVNKDEDYAEIVMEKFRAFAGVPIINLESSTRHPCQSLADLITIEEHKTKPKLKVVLTWVPHFKPLPQAVANSFAEWVNLTDYDFTVCNPVGYDLHQDFVGRAIQSHNQADAFNDADFIYAKNWSSYENYAQVLSQDPSWAINENSFKNAAEGAKFMHCLPVRRGLKVSHEVLDGPRSLVIKQAANRVWSVQAVIKNILSTL